MYLELFRFSSRSLHQERTPTPLHSAASALFLKTTGVGGILPIPERLFHHTAAEESAFTFLATPHLPLATFFPKFSSTGAAMISRTRSRRAGTSSLVSPLVSMVSCR